ncbi:MAG TPA: hypothetical protein VFD70_23430 [Anaerolineae bacterium]|nr:hypothetical protein [Anaerolineae bacterium]
MKKNQFPKGWDEKRIQRVLAHYEKQSADEAAIEDDQAFNRKEGVVVEVPRELMPLIREILAQYKPTQG